MSKENNKIELKNTTTYENYGGYDWRISTYKLDRHSIKSVARAGNFIKNGDNKIYSLNIFKAPKITLSTFEGRATEKNIKETHLKGLIEFKRLKKANELPIKEGYKLKTEIE